jgi:hypothetical protein
MTPDLLFKICNSIAPLGWLLMIIAPKWRWTKTIILSGIFPLLLGLVYVVLIVLFFGKDEGDFNSLQGVMKLFTSPWGVTAGWIHYLAFDMFIGSWELRRKFLNLQVIHCFTWRKNRHFFSFGGNFLKAVATPLAKFSSVSAGFFSR